MPMQLRIKRLKRLLLRLVVQEKATKTFVVCNFEARTSYDFEETMKQSSTTKTSYATANAKDSDIRKKFMDFGSFI